MYALCPAGVYRREIVELLFEVTRKGPLSCFPPLQHRDFTLPPILHGIYLVCERIISFSSGSVLRYIICFFLLPYLNVLGYLSFP